MEVKSRGDLRLYRTRELQPGNTVYVDIPISQKALALNIKMLIKKENIKRQRLGVKTIDYLINLSNVNERNL